MLLAVVLVLAASTALRSETLEQQFQQADAELNLVYKQLRQSLNEQDAAKLKASQRAWITEKDRAVRAVSGQQQKLALLLSLTLQRNDALKEALPQKIAAAVSSDAGRPAASSDFEKADAGMNRAYKKLRGFLDAEDKERLKAGQLSWLERRKLLSTGWTNDAKRLSVLAEDTKERTVALEQVIRTHQNKSQELDKSVSLESHLSSEFSAPERLAETTATRHAESDRIAAIRRECEFWRSRLKQSLTGADLEKMEIECSSFDELTVVPADSEDKFNAYKKHIEQLLRKFRKMESELIISGEVRTSISSAPGGFSTISDDATLVATGGDHLIQLWNAQTGLMVSSYPFSDDICGLQFDLSGKTLYVFHYDGASRYESTVKMSRLLLETGELVGPQAEIQFSHKVMGTVPAVFLDPVTGHCQAIYHDETQIDCLASKSFRMDLGGVEGADKTGITQESGGHVRVYDRSKDRPESRAINPFSKLEMGSEKDIFYLGASGQSPREADAIFNKLVPIFLTVNGESQKAHLTSLSHEGALFKTETGSFVAADRKKFVVESNIAGGGQLFSPDRIAFEARKNLLLLGKLATTQGPGDLSWKSRTGHVESVVAIDMNAATAEPISAQHFKQIPLKKGQVPISMPSSAAEAILNQQNQTHADIAVDHHGDAQTFGLSPQYEVSESQFIARCVDGKDGDYYGIQDMTYWPKVSWSPDGDVAVFYGARFKGRLRGAYFYRIEQRDGMIRLRPTDSAKQLLENVPSPLELSLAFYPYLLSVRNGWVASVDTSTGKVVDEIGIKKGGYAWEGHMEFPAFDIDVQRRELFNLSAQGSIDFISIGADGSLTRVVQVFPGMTGATFVTAESYFMRRGLSGTPVHFVQGYQTYPFEQFDLRLNRPDIVLQRLGAPDEAIAIAKQLREKRLKRMGVTEEMLKPDFHVPQIEIVGDIPSETDADEINLSIKASDSKYPLERLKVFVNNVPVNGRDGESLRDQNSQTLERTISIKLAAGRNKIQVSVLNNAGAESLYANAEINCAANRTKPTLYAVAMGVSEYSNPDWNLKYAAKDARDVLERLKTKAGDSYGEVKELLLTDKEVTKESITKIKDFLSSATIDDTVLMFVAGHGLLDGKYDYYFGTTDIDFNNPADKGIAFEQFDDLLADLPSLKKSLLIDTCHAGELDEEEKTLLASAGGVSAALPTANGVAVRSIGTRGMNVKAIEGARGASEWYDRLQGLFVDLRRGSGSTILSSSAGAEYALESSEQQNGLFTYAVLEALEGNKEADINKDGSVQMSELGEYVKKRVSELTNNKQTPNTRRVNLEGDFVLADARSQDQSPIKATYSARSTIQPLEPATPEIISTASADLSGVKSYWNHNGSVMGLIPNGNSRAFVYIRPREGLQDLVAPGTVLFEGRSDGASYVGTARRFRKGLPPNLYRVSGPIEKNGSRVVLNGVVETRAADGSVEKSVNDVLVFDLLPENPSASRR